MPFIPSIQPQGTSSPIQHVQHTRPRASLLLQRTLRVTPRQAVTSPCANETQKVVMPSQASVLESGKQRFEPVSQFLDSGSLCQLTVLSRPCLTSSALTSFICTNPSSLKFRPCPFIYNKHKDNKCSPGQKGGNQTKAKPTGSHYRETADFKALKTANKEEQRSP